MTSHIDLSAVHLDHGAHGTREQGVCLLELCAWWVHEDHNDHPRCVSPVLSSFGRSWNDALDDQTRQRLIPFVPRMVSTAGDGADKIRAWMLTDWLVRVYAPAFLRTAGLVVEADRLERSVPITGSESVTSLQGALDSAVVSARAAWDVAGDAAWAAWAAAGDAAWDAAGAALKPTVERLQESAFELLGRMCDAGRAAA